MAFQSKDYRPSPIALCFIFYTLGFMGWLSTIFTEQTLSQHILVLRTGGFSPCNRILVIKEHRPKVLHWDRKSRPKLRQTGIHLPSVSKVS